MIVYFFQVYTKLSVFLWNHWVVGAAYKTLSIASEINPRVVKI